MTYTEIYKCTDLQRLMDEKKKMKKRLYGPHGASLTEAQGKFHACETQINLIAQGKV